MANRSFFYLISHPKNPENPLTLTLEPLRVGMDLIGCQCSPIGPIGDDLEDQSHSFGVEETKKKKKREENEKKFSIFLFFHFSLFRLLLIKVQEWRAWVDAIER